jgi:hypothetical protein
MAFERRCTHGMPTACVECMDDCALPLPSTGVVWLVPTWPAVGKPRSAWVRNALHSAAGAAVDTRAADAADAAGRRFERG